MAGLTEVLRVYWTYANPACKVLACNPWIKHCFTDSPRYI